MMSPSELPESFSPLLSVPRRNELNEIKKRKVSAASMGSVASTTDDFIESKIEDVKMGIEYAEKLMKGLEEAYKDGILTEAQYREALAEANTYSTPKEQEIVVLNRQRKIVKEDLEEKAPSYATLEDAYAGIIVSKTMAACAKTKKRKFDQSSFKASVVDFYSAGRLTRSIEDQKFNQAFCHLTGWFPIELIKAAHIVPKSLQSDELAYLFGVGEAVLTDPRNALMLGRTIEVGLDSGLIVLVPLSTTPDQETRWKCVLTDKKAGKDMITQGWHWKDIDGKELEFLNSNRPARRFLYFRFVITYLHCKKEGTMGWVEDVEAKGIMWPSPGPYLRQSLLVSLARKISDHFLPEAFYKQTTFKTVNGSATRPPDEEEGMMLSLVARLKEEKRAVRERGNEEEDSDDEDA